MNEAVFRVQEFILASVLRARGIRFLGAEAGTRVTLLFDNRDGRAEEIAMAHLNGGVGVNSAALTAAYAFVKDQVFALKRSRGQG